MAATNSTIPQLPLDIVSKTGPRLLGYLFHWGLFGVLCVQVYMYYLAFPTDPTRNKSFVYSVFILEVTQTLIITRSAFYVFGQGYGNFAYFNRVELAWFSIHVLTGIVAFIAQTFYAYRISILAQSRKVASFIMALAFVQLGGSIASAVVFHNARLFSKLLSRPFFITSAIWNGGSATCDVIIAIYMTYYLSRHSSTGVKSTQVLLRKVIRLVIGTGTVTAAVAIINLVVTVLPSQPSYYTTTSEILAKVYSNSMMVVLNNRMRIGNDAFPETHTIVSRIQLDNPTRRADAFELGEGVLVTREEIVVPRDLDALGGNGSQASKSGNVA